MNDSEIMLNAASEVLPVVEASRKEHLATTSVKGFTRRYERLRFHLAWFEDRVAESYKRTFEPVGNVYPSDKLGTGRWTVELYEPHQAPPALRDKAGAVGPERRFPDTPELRAALDEIGAFCLLAGSGLLSRPYDLRVRGDAVRLAELIDERAPSTIEGDS